MTAELISHYSSTVLLLCTSHLQHSNQPSCQLI